MGAVAPLAVSRVRIAPTWDDAFFLDRAVCLNRSVYELSPAGVDHCLGAMFKSPTMALLLLPAGPLNHHLSQLDIAPFVLACVTFGLAAWLAWLTFRCAMPLSALAAAAAAIRLCGPLAEAGAPFLVDGSFAIMVGIALFLPILEHAVPAVGPYETVRRGLLWGSIAGIAALSKTTFGLFGVLIVPCLLWTSFRRTGGRATLWKATAAMFACAPPAVMFLRYGSMYLGNGWRSSFGNLAPFYSRGLSVWGMLSQTIASAGLVYWTICVALLFMAIARRRCDAGRLGLGLTIAAIAFVYLLAASYSLNNQPRFFWPVWFIVPIALAGAAAPSRDIPLPSSLSGVLVCFAAMVWSLPMLSYFDFKEVREAAALLRFLTTDHATRLELASDLPEFNVNTLALAQQVDWNALRSVNVGTVVYDVAEGKSPEYSDQQLRDSTFVVLSWPIAVPPAPEFSNRFVDRFLATARACGRLIPAHPGPSDTLLFDMRDTSCRR
jgi:hypothetical protein